MNIYRHTVVLMVVASAIISCHRSTQETFTLEDKYLRFITEKLEYELRNPIVADAYTNSGRPHFVIWQVSPSQSVLRFGYTNGNVQSEVGYQVRVNDQDARRNEFWQMFRTQHMWRIETDIAWPQLDFDSPDVQPYVSDIMSFQVLYWCVDSNDWIAGNWDSNEKRSIPKSIIVAVTGIRCSRTEKIHTNAFKNINDIPGLVRRRAKIQLVQE